MSEPMQATEAGRISQLREDELGALVEALLERELGKSAQLERETHVDGVRVDVLARVGTKTVVVEVAEPPDDQDTAALTARLSRVAKEVQPDELRLVLTHELADEDRSRLASAVDDVPLIVWGPRDLEEKLKEASELEQRFFGEEKPGLVERAVVALSFDPSLRRVPGWLRLGLLLTVVPVLVWLPLEMDRQTARPVALAGVGLLVVTYFSVQATAALGSLVTFIYQPVTLSLPTGGAMRLRLQRLAPGLSTLVLTALGLLVLRLLRLFGGLAYGLGFFLLWGLVYLGLWGFEPAGCASANSCTGAFMGLGESVTFGDFLYFAVATAFLNPPAEPQAMSDLARALVAAQLISSAAVLVAFAQRLGFGQR